MFTMEKEMGNSKYAVGRVVLLAGGHILNRLVSVSVTLTFYYILRFLLTVGIVGITNKAKRINFKLDRKEIKFVILASILMMTATLCFYESMKHLNPSAVAVFDISNTVVISILFALVFTSERLTKQKTLSLLIIFVGLSLCCFSTYMRLGSLVGVLFTVAVGIANSLTNIIIDKVKVTDKNTFFFYQNIGLLALSLTMHLIIRPDFYMHQLAGSYILMVAILVLTTLISLYGNLFVIYSVKSIGIIKTNVILSIVPVTSTIGLALVFQDSISLEFGFGMIIITYGFLRWYRKNDQIQTG